MSNHIVFSGYRV